MLWKKPTARSFAASSQMSFSSEAKNLFANSPLEDDMAGGRGVPNLDRRATIGHPSFLIVFSGGSKLSSVASDASHP